MNFVVIIASVATGFFICCLGLAFILICIRAGK